MDRGKLNALTDVEGTTVGHVTLLHGEPPDPFAVRTGVTAILPHGGDLFREKVEAAVHVINGFGKSLGLLQLAELGEIESPILLTGTLNVFRVADALLDIAAEGNPGLSSLNPVVCECNDGYLSHGLSRPAGKAEVLKAIREARSGAIAEGSVGAGTGMSGLGYKAGIGTSSRLLPKDQGGYTVGTLVLMNTGAAGDLLIDGVPVGRVLAERDAGGHAPRTADSAPGSIIVVIATDAPLSSRQLGRVAGRAVFGLARTGAKGPHGSGDIVLAFSTTARHPARIHERIPEERLTAFFDATEEATEEAIIRSILLAATVRGRDGNAAVSIPIAEVARVIGKYRNAL
jgi:D-aminopeptidase